jgi:hypothetical protein
MVQRTATRLTSIRPTAPGPAADWVVRFVEDERQREQGRRRDARTATARADAVREHVNDLMDSLRERIARDVHAIAQELPDRLITIEDNPPGGGFIVRRGRYPEARLTVEPHPEAGTLRVHYVFSLETGIVAPQMRELRVGGDSVRDLHLVDPDDGTRWHSLGELSEYLLLPVVSGHPRS